MPVSCRLRSIVSIYLKIDKNWAGRVNHFAPQEIQSARIQLITIILHFRRIIHK